jgi:DNA polymerase V
MAPHSGEMVKAALKEKGMTQNELARRIGKDQTLISRYLSGQIEISLEAAISMAEVLDIDFQALRRQLQRDKLERRKEQLRAEFKDVLGEEEKIDVLPSDQPVHVVGAVGVQEIPDAIAVPLLDFIPLGEYDLSKEKSDLYVLPPGIQVDVEKSFALKVSGEDMTDGEIGEGDIIVVDPAAEAQDEDIVLVVLGGKPVLRKIYRRGGMIVLQSSGGNAEPFILSPEDDFHIVGRLALYTRLF